jgi:hypothetical protein
MLLGLAVRLDWAGVSHVNPSGYGVWFLGMGRPHALVLYQHFPGFRQRTTENVVGAVRCSHEERMRLEVGSQIHLQSHYVPLGRLILLPRTHHTLRLSGNQESVVVQIRRSCPMVFAKSMNLSVHRTRKIDG